MSRCLYHATNTSAAQQIDWQGFRPGDDGRQGGAIYLSNTIKEAKRRSRNGSVVVYEVRVRLRTGKYGWDGESYALFDSSQIQSYSRI